MERSGNFYKAIRLGYILISILIGCMAYNSLYEWQEIEALELGNKKIDELRKEINNINIQMIKFSLLGETILEWNDKDIEHYHARRMAMDSMLCRFKATYPAERIDSVRSLLEDKERQMFQIVRLMDEQQSINKKIANQIPVIVQKSVQEQSKKPKRKGFLGIFGKKKEVTPAVSTTILHSVNRNVISEQKVQDRQLSEQADSLAARNAELNRRRKKQNIQSDIVDNEKKNLRNKETNIIAFFFVGLFLATIVYLCIFNVKDAGTIVNNPYNKRVDNQESKVVRGDILADDGDVLATTLTDEDGNETRYYPYDNLFCHSVGFTSLTGMKTGIEQSQNYFLLSETDNVLDQIGNDLSGGKAKGHNVTTTLNVELTKAAYKALGNNKGAVIAMEPATGKILAMVSNPSFDANAVNTDYDEWITYDSADSVLLNRATQGLYPPGSTFKIITALAYIRQNQNDYYNYSYNCDGQAYISGGTTIACFDHTAHGYQDLRKAFANSCNSAFSTIGAGLNKTSFMNLCSTLLFNSNLPVGFEYSKSTMAVTQDSSISEMQETGIGQGRTMMTPLHNMMIAASVANDGVMMTPYIVDSISDSEGRTVVKNKPTEAGTVMSAERQCQGY